MKSNIQVMRYMTTVDIDSYPFWSSSRLIINILFNIFLSFKNQVISSKTALIMKGTWENLLCTHPKRSLDLYTTEIYNLHSCVCYKSKIANLIEFSLCCGEEVCSILYIYKLFLLFSSCFHKKMYIVNNDEEAF